MIKISKTTSYTKIKQNNTWELIVLAFNAFIGLSMLLAVLVLALRESFFERNLIEKLFLVIMALPGISFTRRAYYKMQYLLERPVLQISPENIEIKCLFRSIIKIQLQSVIQIETKEYQLNSEADLVIHCSNITYPVRLILSDEESYIIAKLLKSIIDKSFKKNIVILDLKNTKSKSENEVILNNKKDNSYYFERNIVEKKYKYEKTKNTGEFSSKTYSYYNLCLNDNRNILVDESVFERAIWGYEVEFKCDKDTDHIVDVKSSFRYQVVIKESVSKQRKISNIEEYDSLTKIDEIYKNDYGLLFMYFLWIAPFIFGVIVVTLKNTILNHYSIYIAILVAVLIPCIHFYLKFKKKQRNISSLNNKTVHAEYFTVLDKYEFEKKYYIKKDYTWLEIEKSKFDKINCGDYIEVAKDTEVNEVIFINIIEKKQYRNNLQI